MKKILLLAAVWATVFTAFAQHAPQNYAGRWKSADSLILLGQEQSAQAVVDEIYRAALARHDAPQFIRACLYRIDLQTSFAEDADVKMIEELEAMIAHAEPPAINILHSVAAERYWKYYEKNRWRIRQRTTVEVASDDVRTWDAQQIVTACMGHYTASVAAAPILQKDTVGTYSEILNRGEHSDKYRPALFDFLAFRAIDFYRNHEAGLTQPAAPFLLNDPACFAPAAAFAALPMVTSDTASFHYRALLLLQQTLRFHLHDTDRTALIDADLHRLDLVHQHSLLEEKDSLYLSALQILEAQCAGYPAYTEILYRIARLYDRQGKPLEAMALIEKAQQRFPKSLGAENCRSLKSNIERPALQLTADEAVLPGRPAPVSVRYKNMAKIYYRIVPLDYKELLERPDDDKTIRAYYASLPATQQGIITLPNDSDYLQHTAEWALPALPAGYYAVLFSSDEHFSDRSVVFSDCRIWATRLSYISQSDDGDVRLMVLHRESGQPLAGARVQTYTSEYDHNKRRYVVKYGNTYTTDAEGMLLLSGAGNAVMFLLSHGKENYASGRPVFTYRSREEDETVYRTTLFTDRAIYRPGQTVYFKGVVLRVNNNDPTKTAIVPGRRQTVTLHDVHDDIIAELVVTTNEYGSFAGSFAVPANGLTGTMRLETEEDDDDGNYAYFRVEEYKRPKFETTFLPLQGSYRLHEKVTVRGLAKTYAGSAVSEAKVTYRITREARFPFWCWWWGTMPVSGPQEIIHGETHTDADGSFSIDFTAIPDARVPKKELPVFRYTVTAVVSDLNGETHEAKTTVAVGYRSLLLGSDMPDKVNTRTHKTITLRTTGLNGEKQPAQGMLRIWKLRHPERVLQPRRWEHPDRFLMTRAEFEQQFPHSVYDDEDNMANWEKEQQVLSLPFNTKDTTEYSLSGIHKWPAGQYLLTISANDAFGEPVEHQRMLTLYSDRQQTVPANAAVWFEVLNPMVQPGDTLQVLAGSAYRDVPVIFETITRTDTLRRLLRIDNALQRIEIPVTEAHRGGFTVGMRFVRHNRAYSQQQGISVPYDHKRLHLTFSTFRDKLQPGQHEEWRLTIKDHRGNGVAAELLASMYDASLDAFAPHGWRFYPWRSYSFYRSWNADDAFQYRQHTALVNYVNIHFVSRSYTTLLRPLSRLWVIGVVERSWDSYTGAVASVHTTGILRDSKVSYSPEAVLVRGNATGGTREQAAPPAIQIRTNFNETAFFYPQLKTNAQGETVISFTVPEALTRWKMQGIAWTKDLKTGYTTRNLVTQKDLMLFTNAPRFFREHDTLYFSAKLSNISDKDLQVSTQVQFFDALTMQPLSDRLLLEADTQHTALAAGGNRAISWKMHIPEGIQAITYRITATGGNFSDGEESTLPVLTNRLLVTESLPLPIRGHQTKTYTFDKLRHHTSPTLKHHAYTVEFTSNPAWNAVQALPCLMEYPYDCAEQTFSRYYANSLATHLLNSDPKIKRVFDTWRNYQPAALQSNLEKNEALKMLLLEETPWVRDAQNERERKQRLAVLFDLNRMRHELDAALQKVEQAQTPNGGFAWFSGGPDNCYITRHIVAGIGHLKKLNVPTAASDNLLRRALQYMDDRIAEELEAVKKEALQHGVDYRKADHLSYSAIHYLYARSFFTGDYPVAQTAQEAMAFYRSQAATYWRPRKNIYLKGLLALALHRYGDTKTARLILQSLTDTALHSEEMGMYWKNNSGGWWWYQAPIETQALLIEAYNEIENDRKTVEALKVWLLKQKQTTDWNTTKATTEAIYALLTTGSNLLAADSLCTITVGGQLIDPARLEESERPEAGTGYFKTSWPGTAVTPAMGEITVTNPNPTVAWGAAYWQYFEQLDKITPAETGAKINKQLFLKTNTPTGTVLKALAPDAPIKVGDKITVRLEIRTDRDMEYVHLKDLRAAAFEPLNVLSGYRWQDGMGYYESTRDAATNFFIDYLPKGTHVFEYDLFATQAGEFSNGITSLQCMYAPEFSTHSDGARVSVEN